MQLQFAASASKLASSTVPSAPWQPDRTRAGCHGILGQMCAPKKEILCRSRFLNT